MTTTVRAPVRPRLWIVAGPNGSGKSSAYDRSDVDEFGGSVWIINPDLLTTRLRDTEGLALGEANLAAIQRIESWLDSSIEVHQTIGVETVLSTGKYRRLVEKAKERGFEVRLIYVFLASAELQIERIRLRVAKGGHDVPEQKVRERRERSFDQLAWFFAEADKAWLFDNSGAEPELVGHKDGKMAALGTRLIPELMTRLTG
ncbi:AAA family ATPase [Sphingomonas sp.]|uniref:AAA family ATPase n=1 Tax=Sphingomonas sp. TaxID=28214 RepID=UPI002DD625EE|nr:AAA family ATPase [Sphingomonas sp.]